MYGARGGGGAEAVWELEDPYGGAAGCGSGAAGVGTLRGLRTGTTAGKGFNI